ncbi:DUF2812 domain-containing protein [Planococcus sp. SSTMD024]|uniref:DUF2812 domain-containing protein n=1 Tax=Planococcus sp. SSTMD024 TaxID=3242163 RepID=UPI00351EF3C0
MRKFRVFMDIEKEENWLNAMAEKGWLCTRVSSLGYYHFEKRAESDHVIRIDYQSFKSKEAKERYIELYEDYGWKYLGGSYLHYWLKPADGMDELFSDRSSEKAYLKRLLSYYGTLGFSMVFMTFLLFNNSAQYTSLKQAYFTPGLWDKEGSDFVFVFLFETPFALMRFGMPWLFFVFGIAFVMMYLKFHKKIKEGQEPG